MKYSYIDANGCPRNKKDDSYLVGSGDIWKYTYPSGKYYYCLAIPHVHHAMDSKASNQTCFVAMATEGSRIVLECGEMLGYAYLGIRMTEWPWEWSYEGKMDKFDASQIPESPWIEEENYTLEDNNK